MHRSTFEKQLKFNLWSVFLYPIFVTAIAIMMCSNVTASDFRLGAAIGFGGAGVSKLVTSETLKTPVQASKSEGPGTLSVFIDYLADDYFLFSFEHYRGFRLGPLSSGVSFSGLAGRWYFLGPAPSVSKRSTDLFSFSRLPGGYSGATPAESTNGQATLLIKRISPFMGVGIGVANASVTRENDQVTHVESSGMYVSLKMGADYPTAKGSGFRPEFEYSTTLQNDGAIQGFSIKVGYYIFI